MKRRYIPATAKRAKGVPGQADWRKMAEPKTFSDPKKCVEEREAKILTSRYGSGERKKEKQVLCLACRRWCYNSDRCNLFKAP